MRPLAVLLLVLGALAALFFALTTMTGGGRGEPKRTVAVAPAPTPAGNSEPLTAPPPVVETRAETPEPDAGVRQAVRPAFDPKGPKLAFGAIHGKVVDEDGKPVPGATVSLFDTKPSSLGEDYFMMMGKDRPRALSKAESGPDGQFRFEQLDPRKDWSLEVGHDLYEYWTSEVSIPVPEGGIYPETIVLRPGKTMSGVVRSAASGQPIEGALLVAENPFAVTRPKNKRAQGRLEARSDANGAYAFTNLGAAPGQNRTLTITAPGYATQVHLNFMMVDYTAPSNKVVKNRQEPVRMVGRVKDFDLELGHTIAGRVVGPDRAGMAGVEIEALHQTGAVGSTATTTSGKNGEFLLGDLAEGIYTLRVTATNFDAAPVQRVETGNTNVVIELFELASASGKVVDADGRPLSAFTVKARQTNDVNPAYGAVAAQRAVKGSADGGFELTGIPEGSYVIEASAEGYAACFSEPFTATQGLVASDLVVRMTHGGSLSGQIVDANGAPILGAEVKTVENDYIEGDFWEFFNAIEPSAMTKAQAFSDQDGRFTIDVMTPGLYQVQIRARGYAPTFVKEVEVVEGVETQLPTQVLGRGATILGLVYGRDAAVVSGSVVQLTPADLLDTSNNRQTRSDGTGRFVLENVQPGNYDLSATRPSGGAGNPFEALADINQSKITLSIEEGGRYEVELFLGARPGK
jgi:protocatechuate 3,4-dioxygenase beta subunit